MRWRLSLLLAALLIAAPAAFAAEKQIGTSCVSDQNSADWDTIARCISGTFVRSPYFFGTTSDACGGALAGLTRYNSGVLELCNGTSWVAVGSGAASNLGAVVSSTSPQRSGDATTGLFSPTASAVSVATAGVERVRVDGSGNVGVGGTAASSVSLDVGTRTDSIRPAVGTTAQQPTCNTSLKGAFRFDTDLSTMTMCDGTSWKLIAASVSAGCTGPNAFSFTNVTNAPLSTVITSAAITPAGCNQAMAISVSGGGNPKISVNNGAWTTSTAINPGDSVRVQLTSSSNINTTLSAIVVIGSTTGTTWTVTTVAGNTRIFATAGTYNGNLGGLTGADALCNSLAAGLGYGSYWRAVLSDSFSNARDRLTITYPVVKASATATTIAVSNLWLGTLNNAIAASGDGTWTGSDTSGVYNSGYACNDWTSASGGLPGRRGLENYTNGDWLSYYSVPGCNALQHLYCIEQPDPGCSPSAFSFTDLTNQALSTTATSNTVTPSGCATAATVQVFGQGSPQININGAGWVTSGTISPGQTLQVRLTTSSAYSSSYKARIVIGATTTTWSVTTLAASGSKIFLSSGTYNANFGGLAGADSACNTEATNFGYSGYWKSVMSDSLSNARDRLSITYPLTSATSGAVIAVSNLWTGSLANPVGGPGTGVWTGSDSSGVYNSGLSCNDWTSASSGLQGRRGHEQYADSNWLSYYSLATCNAAQALYCISQPDPGCSPSAFSFTNLTGQALTSLVTSNTITPSGCAVATAVQVLGQGSPQISINGGSWVTSGTISPGQTLQVRLTTGGNYNTSYQARITIGATTSTWNVTTLGASGSKIFVSSTTYSGNLGGVVGADAACNTLAAGLGYSGYWRAVLSDSLANASDRITNLVYPVINASNGTVVAPASLWGSLSTAIGTSGSGVWTGSDNAGNYYGYGCNDWTSSSSGVSGRVGIDSFTSQWLNYGGYACNNAYLLYCVSQTDPGCSPAAFSFTNLTSQARSTLVTSNTVTPSGCASDATVQVFGQGSPQISINGGGWTTSGTISSGQTIQVRLTTSSAFSTTYKARVVIGKTATTWSATTLAPSSSQIFSTANTYNGNFGGLSGADTTCMNEASAYGFSGTWKAILSTSTTNANSRFTLTYPVVSATSGAIVAASNLWGGSLSNAVSGNDYSTYTGSDSSGANTGNNCSNWTSASGSVNGTSGRERLTNSAWLNEYNAFSCNNVRAIYCIKE